MKFVLLAMESVYSRAVLARLAAQPGANIAALVIPESAPAGFPLVRVPASTSSVELAHRAGIAVIPHRDDAALAGRLQALRPDVVAVACYPRRVASRIADAARHACVNLHPSLLPRYRGPDPLFWQLRDGLDEIGITVHRVEPRVDAGAVAATRTVAVPSGARRDTLDGMLGDAAACLLLERIAPGTPLSYRPQGEFDATAHPLPSACDRVLSTRWPVVRAFNFLRGAAPRGSVFRVRHGELDIEVDDATGWRAGRLEGIKVHGDGTISAGFDGGIIRLRAVRSRTIATPRGRQDEPDAADHDTAASSASHRS